MNQPTATSQKPIYLIVKHLASAVFVTSEPDVEPLTAGEPELELRASQIGLGYDENERVFTLHAFDAENTGENRVERRPAPARLDGDGGP